MTLLLITAVVALNSVDRNMLALVLPQLKRELRLSDTMLGMLAGPAFTLMYALAGVPMAWIADRSSRSRIILLGLTFWSLVTAATGLAGNAIELAAARVALGLGEATTTAPASALVADLFPPSSRPAAFSVLTCGAPIGIMIGFPVVGWISLSHGWRSAFFLTGSAGLLLALLMVVFAHDAAPPVSSSAVQAGNDALTFSEGIALAFRSRDFLLLVAGGTLLSVGYGVMTAWAPTLLQRVHGLTSLQAGDDLGVYRGFFGIAASLGGGLLVTLLNRRDPRWLAWMPGLLCLLTGPAETLFLFGNSAYGWQAALGADTLLVSAATPCTFALLLAVVDPRMRALGASLYLLVFQLVGQSIGPPLVGALNERFAPLFGADAIRYSMLSAPVAMVLAGLTFLALSPYMRQRPG